MIALKIDVDTRKGMVEGVPRLLGALGAHRVRATFFLSFGPDNSGKAIFNLFRGAFLKKMLRTGGLRLYGWRTALYGTILPAPIIALDMGDLIRRIEREGHEVEVHAWDHRTWQDRLPRMGADEVREQFLRSFASYEAILGRRPRAVAAPGWVITPDALAIEDELGLDYASDTREGPPFVPIMGGRRFRTVQIPSTFPCLEEKLGDDYRDIGAFYDDLARDLRRASEGAPGAAAVVPLHAEVEGHSDYVRFFGRLLAGIERLPVATLGEVAASMRGRELPALAVSLRDMPGRGAPLAMPEVPRG